MGLSALGKTDGVVAAGAWAARIEIASLLEEGIEVDTLFYLIRKGREDNRKLTLDGSLEDPESEESEEDKGRSSLANPSSGLHGAARREVLGDLSEEEWNLALRASSPQR